MITQDIQISFCGIISWYDSDILERQSVDPTIHLMQAQTATPLVDQHGTPKFLFHAPEKSWLKDDSPFGILTFQPLS